MTQMAYHPPLPRRWYVYCAIAFIAPGIVLQFVAPEEVPWRDLVWLITLVPAYLLSYENGMRGAVAGLLMGTVLFTAIQLLAALHLGAEDWRVTVPIYLAYGTIAISVGWLSERLHLYYNRAIDGERVQVVQQVAVTIQHEVNNALAAIVAGGQLLQQAGVLADSADREAVAAILAQAARIRISIQRLATLAHAPTTEYAGGVRMIDLAGPDLGLPPGPPASGA